MPFCHLIRSWDILGRPMRFIRTYWGLIDVLIDILRVVWIAGMVVFVFKDARALHRAYAVSRSYPSEESGQVNQVAKRLSIRHRIVVSQEVKLPYVAGLFRHTIYLPVLRFPDEELGFVLRHEAQHIRSRDSLVKLMYRLLMLPMWWNPITNAFWPVLDDLLEMNCDAIVTKHMDARERNAYADMLDNMRKLLKGSERLSPLVVDELFTVSRDDFLDQRLAIIRDGTGKPPRPVSVVVSCVLAVLFCLSYMVIFQPAIDPPVEDFQDDFRTNYDEKYDDHDIEDGSYDVLILKGSDGRYQLFVDYVFSGYLTEGEVNSDPYCNYPYFEEGE